MPLKDFFIVLEQLGFTEVVLPFVLVFTVVFAVLQKSRVLGVEPDGKPKTRINAMVAFVLAFLVLAMTRTLFVITWFARYAALLALAFVFLGILMAFLGAGEKFRNVTVGLAFALLSLVLLQVLAFADVISPDVMRWLLPLVIAVLVFAGLVWYFLKPVKPSKKPEPAPPAEPYGPRRPRQVPEFGIEEPGPYGP